MKQLKHLSTMSHTHFVMTILEYVTLMKSILNSYCGPYFHQQMNEVPDLKSGMWVVYKNMVLV
jgi:hypothetical protein